MLLKLGAWTFNPDQLANLKIFSYEIDASPDYCSPLRGGTTANTMNTTPPNSNSGLTAYQVPASKKLVILNWTQYNETLSNLATYMITSDTTFANGTPQASISDQRPVAWIGGNIFGNSAGPMMGVERAGWFPKQSHNGTYYGLFQVMVAPENRWIGVRVASGGGYNCYGNVWALELDA